MKVNYEDVSILREGLARVYKQVPPPIQKEIFAVLARYGKQVRSYCDCPRKIYQKFKMVYICLDCGKQYMDPKGKPLEVEK